MKRDAEFLRKVTELASKNNMGATAKALKIPVYTLKARLLSAAMKLGEIPPQFAKTRVAKKLQRQKSVNTWIQLEHQVKPEVRGV